MDRIKTRTVTKRLETEKNRACIHLVLEKVAYYLSHSPYDYDISKCIQFTAYSVNKKCHGITQLHSMSKEL